MAHIESKIFQFYKGHALCRVCYQEHRNAGFSALMEHQKRCEKEAKKLRASLVKMNSEIDALLGK